MRMCPLQRSITLRPRKTGITLPPSITAKNLEEMTLDLMVPDKDDSTSGDNALRLTITRQPDHYDILCSYTPALGPLPPGRPVRPGWSWSEAEHRAYAHDQRADAAARGQYEFYDAPLWFRGIARRLTEAFAAPHSVHAAETGPSYIPIEHAYQPNGPWERVYTTPADPTITARMTIPRATAKHSFRHAVSGLIDHWQRSDKFEQ